MLYIKSIIGLGPMRLKAFIAAIMIFAISLLLHIAIIRTSGPAAATVATATAFIFAITGSWLFLIEKEERAEIRRLILRR